MKILPWRYYPKSIKLSLITAWRVILPTFHWNLTMSTNWNSHAKYIGMKKLKWLEEFDKIHKKRLSSPYRVPKSVLFIKPCSPSRARRRFFWPNRSQKYVFSSSSHLTNQFTQSFPTEQELRRASSLSDDCTLMARNTQEGRGRGEGDAMFQSWGKWTGFPCLSTSPPPQGQRTKDYSGVMDTNPVLIKGSLLIPANG